METYLIKDLPVAEAKRLLHLNKKQILLEFYNESLTGFPFILTAFKGPTGLFLKICQFKLIKLGNSKMTSELFDADLDVVKDMRIGHVYFNNTLWLDQTIERKSNYRALSSGKFVAHVDFKVVSQRYDIKPMGTPDNLLNGIKYIQDEDFVSTEG
ncbi:MAG: hypothetical protein IPG21_02835 [Saprospiraceae bacterium]|nr:hypothetical protein [Candidatus Vicinibacter affinis]